MESKEKADLAREMEKFSTQTLSQEMKKHKDQLEKLENENKKKIETLQEKLKETEKEKVTAVDQANHLSEKLTDTQTAAYLKDVKINKLLSADSEKDAKLSAEAAELKADQVEIKKLKTQLDSFAQKAKELEKELEVA